MFVEQPLAKPVGVEKIHTVCLSSLCFTLLNFFGTTLSWSLIKSAQCYAMRFIFIQLLNLIWWPFHILPGVWPERLVALARDMALIRYKTYSLPMSFLNSFLLNLPSWFESNFSNTALIWEGLSVFETCKRNTFHTTIPLHMYINSSIATLRYDQIRSKYQNLFLLTCVNSSLVTKPSWSVSKSLKAMLAVSSRPWDLIVAFLTMSACK